MSTSGSYSFSLNKNQMIRRALHMMNIFDLNATVDNATLAFCSDLLNGMLKSWEAEGIYMWKRRQATLFPALNTSNYAIGQTGWHCANSYLSNILTSTAASSATTLQVISTGMTIGDFIGIQLDNGTRQWTTIATIPNGTSVTITNALTSQATSGNTVLSYTTKINRPLQIMRATTVDLSNNSEIMLAQLGYDEYLNMPIKTTAGRPNNYFYDKILTNGQIYLYPVTNNVNILINFTYADTFQDMNSATDDVDFPQEWVWPIVINLAVEIGYAYGKYVELQQFEQKASTLRMALQYSNSDDSPLRISFDGKRGL